MDKKLKKSNVLKIPDNVFKLISKDWMLITAGRIDDFNTMTASWAGFGELWNKKVCFCFIRPVRYTYQFTEREDIFTLTFFEEKYRKVLNRCGTKSGRDIDKMKGIGLTPVKSEHGSVYFSEARLMLECRKIYIHDLDPANFLDPAIEKEYPDKDYHRMYIGEVLNCLMK
ncbi:MAG: flavin reductase family protein [candidate division Zixibacteria bacterium]|nr:flavin reductase family protein [candidate division Zixibacteria bacterium]